MPDRAGHASIAAKLTPSTFTVVHRMSEPAATANSFCTAADIPQTQGKRWRRGPALHVGALEAALVHAVRNRGSHALVGGTVVLSTWAAGRSPGEVVDGGPGRG